MVPGPQGPRRVVPLVRHDGASGRPLPLPRDGLRSPLAARGRGAHGARGERRRRRRQHAARPEGGDPQGSKATPSRSRVLATDALSPVTKAEGCRERGPLAPPAGRGRRRRLAGGALRLPRPEARRAGRPRRSASSTRPATSRPCRWSGRSEERLALLARRSLRRSPPAACAERSQDERRSGAASTASRRR